MKLLKIIALGMCLLSVPIAHATDNNLCLPLLGLGTYATAAVAYSYHMIYTDYTKGKISRETFLTLSTVLCVPTSMIMTAAYQGIINCILT